MKFPILPTIFVAAAVATMIGLGVWQLQRMGEKEALVDTYLAAADQPTVAWPDTPDTELLYRRATGFCVEPMSWRALAGSNRDGETGWQHIAACRTGGGEGPGMQAVMGWSRSPTSPDDWMGGEVTGIIALDAEYGLRLVSEDPAPGLEAVARPSAENIPNNHLLYAIQWFFFAAAALVIFVLAVRRRRAELEEIL
ncbi:SURF1 family protein [Parasphingopyxis sp. CP4]|uniref:SURF1 family protein n=1 Tax=Parasphingopyxis sp. CP4 TaxID=2724527 RepID=UPI0015A17E51|nr:SURF1 family protein [Parasphingopyxis sp. CP4]QLC22310.1 SURF1 family protein [Parasphingopyxis sp. CP4]